MTASTAPLRARNLSRSTALAERLEVADGLWGKFMGLMGRPGLEPDAGLWLTDSNGIHMMFMRFAIDAVFLGSPIRAARAHGPSCPSIAGCGRGPGSCRWCAARTACWNSPSARSSGAGRRSATSSRWSRPTPRKRQVTGR